MTGSRVGNDGDGGRAATSTGGGVRSRRWRREAAGTSAGDPGSDAPLDAQHPQHVVAHLAEDALVGVPGMRHAVLDHLPDPCRPRAHHGDPLRQEAGLLHVVGDEEARRRLESIVHPRVRARAAEIEAAAPDGAVVVHVIPLLVETGQQASFDEVVVVDVPPDVQQQRLVTTRGMTSEQVTARVAAQAGRDERLAAATQVVVNDGTLEDLRDAVDKLWARLQALSTR